MKQALKLILSTLFGACIGFGAVMFCIVMFTGTSASDLLGKMGNVQIVTLLLSCVLSMVCLILAVFMQIILHEAGHLVFGLATGYRFVSFRVGNITLIKDKGRFRFKRFSISGTGGQCLLSPPDRPYRQLPYFWYNAGGVLINLLTAIIALVLWIMFPEAPMALHMFLLLFFICGFFLALMNGIPMKMSGITNDAYNLIFMYKDPESRKYLAQQLSINAALMTGTRLKDMPETWFPDDEITDYSNTFQVSAKAAYGSLHIDRGDFEAAEKVFRELMQHEGEIAGLFVKEISCELLFLELAGARRKEEIERLYSDKLKGYALRYKNMMSSKQRLLCALALYYDNQPEKAKEIYGKVARNQDRYLQQGEVIADLEIMEKMLREAGVQL